MIQRFYVHNFRCLENFELAIAGRPSVLLIGKNGAGKTTAGFALEVLQKIARGTNRADEVVKPKDLARGRTAPMRFEIEARLGPQTYKYSIAFEFPAGFKEMRVLEEGLSVDGVSVFTRELAQVHLAAANPEREARFRLDWHLAALPLVQERDAEDPLFIFRRWLAHSVILRPVPSLIRGESEQKTLLPNAPGTDFGAWFSGLLAYAPAAYARLDAYLKQAMPDLKEIRNPVVGRESRRLEVQFLSDQDTVTIPFADLSDGEKCFMLCAMLIAANEAYGPLVCFWDEPDSHLALSEVGHLVMALRKAFQSGGQLIATSHNPEAIRRFSEENTLLLYRRSHLEPTNVRPLRDVKVHGDLISALIRDDMQP